MSEVDVAEDDGMEDDVPFEKTLELLRRLSLEAQEDIDELDADDDQSGRLDMARARFTEIEDAINDVATWQEIES